MVFWVRMSDPPRPRKDATAGSHLPAVDIGLPPTELPLSASPPRLPPESPAFAPGVRIAERYRLERILGRGGTGDVYEVWDDDLGIPVALKALRFGVGRRDPALRRLKQEAMLARAVIHPNVCRVYDIGCHIREPGQEVAWFLTMEVLRGETLRQRLRSRGRFTPEEALPLVKQMAAGLEAAHQAGVVHGDFKSANVMIVDHPEGQQAVITDFGLARRAFDIAGETERKEEGEGIAGTPAYMAPKQVRGSKASPAADIYAMGVVLYEMVTGILPFKGRTPWETAMRRLEAPPSPPRSVVPDLEEHWEQVILRCLSQEPRERFSRADEVAAALAGLTESQDESDSPTMTLPRHALPAARDPFVGREEEIANLREALASGERLVTLVGAAGMGKTRIAIHYGNHELATWPGGVWFCDLTEARTLDGAVSTIARSLGVDLGRAHPVTQLGHAMANRGRCLVILDNCEQVVESIAPAVSQWLDRAQWASFLITSRERLHLYEESVQQIEPLGFDSALALFVERARHLRPGLKLAGVEFESVKEVVRLVEGMPLAIELAAARMRVMSAEKLVAAMRNRFRLLTGGASSRHETLAAAIDGSWDLLQAWEMAAMEHSSVFDGGFTLEAAERVIDLTPWPEAPWVVDVVQSLVDKSLLRMWIPESRDPDNWERAARFGMYVSVQEYARQKLDEERSISGTRASASARLAEARHGEWYARFGTEEAIEGLEREGGTRRQRALERELPNLIAACRRAVAEGDGKTAAAAFRAACAVFHLRGPFTAAVELGQEVLSVALGIEERASVLATLGRAEWRAWRMQDAHAHLDMAMNLYRQLGDRRGEGLVLSYLGSVHGGQGRMKESQHHFEAALAIQCELGNRGYEANTLRGLGVLHADQGRSEEARAIYEAALATYRDLGDRRGEGITLGFLGGLHADQGRMEEARAHYEASIAIHRELGDRDYEGTTLSNLGLVHNVQGRKAEARALFEAALAMARELGDRRREAVVLGYLGVMLGEESQHDEARAYHETALSIHREVGDRGFEGIALVNLGGLSVDQGRVEEARAHYEAALVVTREVGMWGGEGVVLSRLAELHLMQGRVDEARESLAKGEPILREFGDPVELAKLLCRRAEMEWRSGDRTKATESAGEAETLAKQVGATPESELGRIVLKVRETLR